MAKTNPFEFIQQVRSEVSKVTWPSQRETLISTVMVMVLSVIAAMFFFAADHLIYIVVKFILSLGT